MEGELAEERATVAVQVNRNEELRDRYEAQIAQLEAELGTARRRRSKSPADGATTIELQNEIIRLRQEVDQLHEVNRSRVISDRRLADYHALVEEHTALLAKQVGMEVAGANKKRAKKIEERYRDMYHDVFESFRKDEAEYLRQLQEYRAAFPDFRIPSAPDSEGDDSDSEYNPAPQPTTGEGAATTSATPRSPQPREPSAEPTPREKSRSRSRSRPRSQERNPAETSPPTTSRPNSPIPRPPVDRRTSRSRSRSPNTRPGSPADYGMGRPGPANAHRATSPIFSEQYEETAESAGGASERPTVVDEAVGPDEPGGISGNPLDV